MTTVIDSLKHPKRDGGRILDAASSETERRKEASWYFYLSEISLLRLRRRMANEIKNFEPGNNSVSLPNLATMINEHEQQVLAWVHALPQSMSLEAPPEEDEVCRFVLRGHLINVYEMLYWPFPDCGYTQSAYSRSHTTVIEFATKGLQKHVDRIITNRPGFQHRHHGTFGMIVSCTRSALILLAAGQAFASAAAASRQVPCSMPIGWEAAVQEVVQLNASWEYEAPDLSRMVLILNDLWYHWTRASQHQLA
ncbi:hypothetical protein SNOG_10646 [Parastagonospora nodorum SN15]|uniref:Transcription factor domain-containing protein n=1 Tax=Phaeosphaeria nodorum (strain SN15 / ATCC MYA-4574 / FGSC 10173) TaxID=321614 RepID=Q0UC68_PHANO|nr:hypothetical protein SNOG_10646 [Parastagonospora nodorum SN15]EAT82040.1 hypothetical protein SNOG_10646 [Parastagonospora nodorum SN15]